MLARRTPTPRPEPLPEQTWLVDHDAECTDVKIWFSTCHPYAGKPATLMGCTRTLARRFRWLNSLLISGTSTKSRQGAGFWRLVMCIVIPADRELDGRKLEEHWRSHAKKRRKKVTEGLRLAAELRLRVIIDADTMRADPSLESLVATNAAALVYHEAVDDTRPSIVDGIDFSRNIVEPVTVAEPPPKRARADPRSAQDALHTLLDKFA